MKCPAWEERGELAALQPVVEDIVRSERLAPSPLTVTTIETWHRRLFEGRVSPEEYVGSVRQRDPQRPCLAQNVVAAGGPGMHFDRVPTALAELCVQTTHHLERAAHWQMPVDKRALALTSLLARAMVSFLRIHPFLDGNSRVARLWLHALTQRLGLGPLLVILPPTDPKFPELKRAAMAGDASPWLTFFGDRLIAQLTASP
ncbi:MAG: hypothetical protein EOO70_05795 [Myxococcaceae bacterium]|nr:MAG: hypothetical protein EOO70_05795 [Myxococcaceae bacterium]